MYSAVQINAFVVAVVEGDTHIKRTGVLVKNSEKNQENQEPRTKKYQEEVPRSCFVDMA